jgi:hypothetical protein
VVVIVWWMDFQLPMPLVAITTNVVSLNTAHGEVYSIQHYVIMFVSDLQLPKYCFQFEKRSII